MTPRRRRPKPMTARSREAKGDAKPPVKPVVGHANAKPDATAKSGAAADPSATKPVKPKTTTAAKPSTKPAPKSNSGDAKPAG